MEFGNSYIKVIFERPVMQILVVLYELYMFMPFIMLCQQEIRG